MTTDRQTQINKIISDHIDPQSQPYTDDTLLSDLDDFDSLDKVAVGIALEDEFGLDLLDDKIEACQTVGDLKKLIPLD